VVKIVFPIFFLDGITPEGVSSSVGLEITVAYMCILACTTGEKICLEVLGLFFFGEKHLFPRQL